ncbi:MAG: TonB-dependent receptor, partial [Hyphomicrobiales bacterium]
SGNPVDRLSVIAGAVFMQPRVTGDAVRLGRVGRKPLGQPSTILRANADYQLGFMPGVSLDVAISWFSRRASSRDNRVSVDAYGLVDMGARYRFLLGKSPATVRVQVQNIMNTFAWTILGSNTYGLMDRRRVSALLTIDL